MDLCGGNLIPVVNDNGRVLVKGDGTPIGGMFAELPEPERSKACCEWLADWIERSAAIQGEGGKPPTYQFSELRNIVRDQLKGQERAVMDGLCDAGGEKSLADIKMLCGWLDPIESCWNSLRLRLNKKLHSYGWKIITHDRVARLKTITTHPSKGT